MDMFLMTVFVADIIKPFPTKLAEMFSFSMNC